MSLCYLGCDEALVRAVREYPAFAAEEIIEVSIPITAAEAHIDLLIVGSRIEALDKLAATISDWNTPPASLFVIPEHAFEATCNHLSHHPRVGRSIFFCSEAPEAVIAGLAEVHQFAETRKSLGIDNAISGNFCAENISPRWLFQTMMEHLDEYIYFKDSDSKFLAVSRYLAENCGMEQPADVLGLHDFDLFDRKHSEDAYRDERRIATGEVSELYKEEKFVKEGKPAWVASRKLPLFTRTSVLVGSFGFSRDITLEKELHEELEKNHARMQAELLLARNLQNTLMRQSVPDFYDAAGHQALEIATKYIPSFHLSGDYFSIVKLADGTAGILLADVMGHGVRAAMVTAMIQIAVQQLQFCAGEPTVFMRRLNEIMQRSMEAAEQTLFATAIYCHLDLKSRRLSYVQAGERHGVYVPGGEAEHASAFEATAISPALGLLPDAEYSAVSLQLNKGDEVVLYTDGIVEAAAGSEQYDEKRMLEFLMRHRRDSLDVMLNDLVESVQDFTNSKALEDDVCLIALRLTG